ncbi:MULTISPECIES: hypothetical protein [Methylobacterium]|uniref:hypothetical protein n=1 Tax=Methylobacterium TaxID=407 RepID=UPI0012E825C7|nr:MULTISPECIES: hypothetical protein [Methylobacterium]MCI9880971.1 hypothetical protein [Methylobacterium goesingense]
MMPSTGQARRIWTAPAIIAAVTLGSLIGALLTEEADRDAIAALILFLTFAYAIGLGLSRRKDSPRRSL